MYYADIAQDGTRRTHSMARCSFKTNTDFRFIASAFERRRVPSMDMDMPAKYLVHETDVPPLLQFLCERGLKQVGWHNFIGFMRADATRDTVADIEFDCLWTGCSIGESAPPPQLEIWGFDIEAYTSVPSRMPRADVPLDCIFQISLLSSTTRYLLYTGSHPIVIDGTTALHFQTETDLIIGFYKLLHEIRPDVLTGYNILGFDFKYIIDRSQLLRCFTIVQKGGLHKHKTAAVQEIKWSSSAYRNQQFVFVPLEGIIIFDLLPIIRRDYKLGKYTLDAVVKEFLGADEGKDNVTPYQIHLAWKNNDAQLLNRVGKYCVHDSALVLSLLTKLVLLPNMIEMANICHVAILDLYIRGQQLKVFSQVYRHCYKNMVIDRDFVKYDEGYAGARVFDPVPGIYENVVSFDFNSLYPTTIIAANICFSTCALDENIPDSQCHVLEWDDHIGCDHDEKIIRRQELAKVKRTEDTKREYSELMKYKPKYKICTHRRIRFIKHVEGVMPHIIKKLLAERKVAKQQLKLHTPGSVEYTVLNAQQNALKVSANSMYGCFGVTRGYLPFMPAAMAITYLGRQNVLKAARLITTVYGGELIYGDTDSVYATFPQIKTHVALWDWACHVAEQVTREFPKPLNLEFESTIYLQFLMLTKKKYVYRGCDKNGSVAPALGKKGVLLVRRDCCQFSKTIYEMVIHTIFAGQDLSHCVCEIITQILLLVSRATPLESLTMSKLVGDCNDCEITGETETGKIRIGDYTIPAMTDNKLRKKGVTTEKEYINASLPGQVQLANRMRTRGQIVENGSRIEYLVTDLANWNGKIGLKIEDIDFYRNNNWWLTLDYLYYIRTLITPIDQLFWTVYKQDFIMTKLYATFLNHYKVMQELRKKFGGRVVLVY